MYNLEEVLREKKTIKQGMKFKPSVWAMLKELSAKKNMSMAEILERLAIEEYKKIQKESEEK